MKGNVHKLCCSVSFFFLVLHDKEVISHIGLVINFILLS